jgi:hypothetical protein
MGLMRLFDMLVAAFAQEVCCKENILVQGAMFFS